LSQYTRLGAVSRAAKTARALPHYLSTRGSAQFRALLGQHVNVPCPVVSVHAARRS